MSTRRLTVDPGAAGSRLDAFLAAAGAAPSVAAAKRAVERGLVRVDGRRARKGVRLAAGQLVEVTATPAGAAAAAAPVAGAPSLAVLHEDADLVAVAKPAGMPSQELAGGRGDSVAAALIRMYPECAGASPDPREGGLGHRLDTATSGVLLAARHPAAWRGLRAALAAADCQKVYLAEVVGRPPQDHLVVSAPIGRIGRRGARVKVGGGGRRPLEARTEVALVEHRPVTGTSLVEARLARGRAHQVRAHLAHVGCPVVGDDHYGPGGGEVDAGGLRLHARAVTLRHPATGRMLRIEAPIPAWAVTVSPRGR